jgi:hypothetical protein
MAASVNSNWVQVKRFLSDDHFSVDGTLFEAWVSLKSFRTKDASVPGSLPPELTDSHLRDASRSKGPESKHGWVGTVSLAATFLF